MIMAKVFIHLEPVLLFVKKTKNNKNDVAYPMEFCWKLNIIIYENTPSTM